MEVTMYNKASEIIELANKNNCRICDIVIENECRLTEKTEKEVREAMRGILNVMLEASKNALEKEVTSVSGLSGGDAKLQESYRKSGKTICGDVVNKALARALSCSEVNAAMGRIVAAPTAGASGIIPAAVITAGEIIGANEDAMIDALFTASGVGQIIAKNATLSGAEGGCQAECGSGSAMAAAALVEMYGGTPQMAFDAGSMAIKSKLGLVCDPVAGLVEIPCIKRNATGAVEAMVCADMALAGIKSMIPFDEVVETMYKIGKALPMQLRETALGGLATTPTGLKLNDKVKGK